MPSWRWLRRPSVGRIQQSLPWLVALAALVLVRFGKGAGPADLYALISRPFWPGPAQRQWIDSATSLEQRTRLSLLERDNARLRGLLDLADADATLIAAPVISRSTAGWWQQLELGRGSLHGLQAGDAVMGPGGLIGTLASVTPSTARVRLLTARGSDVGVWVPRTRRHGLLEGAGSSRPVLRFLDKDPQVRVGDVVTTSPASTLVPANLPVGVIASLDERSVPAPTALLQPSAPVAAIDWVQIRRLP
ncbi:rod shape-determining protein MreC [Synechococcus sp. RSCCF101]|uniref:rod shape-determining protein MreC n=1 Tax=Synechococcus sp. RSCCF101 TaxID=2511069 RepID=UPI0012446794|nr:rod shape-determining protein MreC [Synechococcus sp. RSCCF101]QEY32486.1 rod shape-determining protein MreC [Synechococcus sp. RSCCF101]